MSQLSEYRLQEVSKNIIAAKQNLARNYLVLGKMLSIVRREQLFAEADYNNFDQFLADPEICISYATASRLINCYEVFVEHYKLDEEELKLIDFSKVAELLPIVRSKTRPVEEVRKLLQEAHYSTIRDIRIRKKEMAGVTPEYCKHHWVERKQWRCTKCNDVTYQDPFATTQK